MHPGHRRRRRRSRGRCRGWCRSTRARGPRRAPPGRVLSVRTARASPRPPPGGGSYPTRRGRAAPTLTIRTARAPPADSEVGRRRHCPPAGSVVTMGDMTAPHRVTPVGYSVTHRRRERMGSANGAATRVATTRRGRLGRLVQRPLVGPLTTPAGLRAASAALVVTIVVFGAIAIGAARHRQDAAETVGVDATPLLLSAEELYIALADADATGSTSFLAAGDESPTLHARYLADIEDAGRHLVAIAAQDGLSTDARAAVTTLAAQLGEYIRFVEAGPHEQPPRPPGRHDLPAAGVGPDDRRDAPGRQRHLRGGRPPPGPGLPRRDVRRTGHRCARRRRAGVGPARARPALRGPAHPPAPQRRSARRIGAGRRPPGVGHRLVQRPAARPRPVRARRVGPAAGPVDDAHPHPALAERREPPPHRAGHGDVLPRRLRRRHGEHHRTL